MTTDFWRTLLLPPLLLLALNPAALAQRPLQPLHEISGAAADAALAGARAAGYEEVTVQVRPLDERLRLRRCEQPLTTFTSQSGRAIGPVSIGVRCEGAAQWTLYVRTEVSAMLTVPVLARALPRGAIIASSDLQISVRAISSDPSAVILDTQRIVGLELKRPLAAGSPLRFSMLEAPQLIERGQTVTLVAGSSGLEVRMQGKAMGNAAAGERLLVTNLNSGRRVEGVVSPDGSVKIP